MAAPSPKITFLYFLVLNGKLATSQVLNKQPFELLERESNTTIFIYLLKMHKLIPKTLMVRLDRGRGVGSRVKLA